MIQQLQKGTLDIQFWCSAQIFHGFFYGFWWIHNFLNWKFWLHFQFCLFVAMLWFVDNFNDFFFFIFILKTSVVIAVAHFYLKVRYLFLFFILFFPFSFFPFPNCYIFVAFLWHHRQKLTIWPLQPNEKPTNARTW